MKIKHVGFALLLGAGTLSMAAPPSRPSTQQQTLRRGTGNGWTNWGGGWGQYGNGDYWGGWGWLLPASF